MTRQKINKSDYTDRKGVVHSSIGENIRSDNNQLSVDYLNSMNEDERLMFPFFPFKKGKWEKVFDIITSNAHSTDKYLISGSDNNLSVEYRVKFAIVINSEIAAKNSGISYVVPRQEIDGDFTYIQFSGNLSPTDDGKLIEMCFYVEDE